MTQRLQIKVHPEFKRVYASGIIRFFDKTPPEIVCPHFWELNWAYGCRFNCSYCYLQGTFHGKKGPWHRPVDQVFQVLSKFFQDYQGKTQVLNSGELTDSLVYPNIIKQIADKFEECGVHKLLLLTKSSNVELFIEHERKQTIFSFSINAAEVWKRWEHNTPSPDKRIEAAKTVSEAGYETRVRIDPVFPIEDWKEHYGHLVYSLLSKLTPERITLGTPRGLAKTLMFSRDLSWAKYFTEKSAWGKKIPSILREEIYLFFFQMLSDSGFDKSKISICKETTEMWHRIGMNPEQCKCNCIW
jgi:spore photoproduct lyase